MHKCTEHGCARTFKRPEHLSRHRLNHQPRKIHHCLVCQKDFVRLDLLHRHLQRHDRGMVYRNSGGFSTSGDPRTGRPEDAGESPSPTPTPGADPGVELRGQSAWPEAGSGVAIDAPASEIVDLSSALGNASDPTILAAVQQASPAPTLAQATTATRRLGERLDVEPLIFFDGSADANGVTQSLDWLFGASPWDVPELQGFDMHTPTAEDLAKSPSSEGSRPFVIAPVRLESAFLVQRQNILSALACLPPEDLASSFFEAANLERFMQTYWESYNPHFSLLHRPTFSVQDAPPLLLVALLTLGATLSPDEEHYRVAERIHQSLRWLIFTSPSFQVPAPLWVVQALLVVQSYEKMFSTRTMHEMSHIFHYSIITLMRRGSCYSPDREDDGDSTSMEKAWYRWTARELSCRAAYFAFIMDAQHSSIFGHTAALSITDIQLPVPCAEALWEASTAAAWNRERNRVQPSPLFLPALRALLSRQPIPHTYSPFARFALLHGLFCLIRHMKTTDKTASYISVPDQQRPGLDTGPCPTPEQDNWKDRLDGVIDTWSFSLLSQSTSLCLEAARSLQRIAHISIHISLVDFHILAGAPNLATGVRARSDSIQFTRAYKRVSAWARHRNAKRALSHCLLHVQETMFSRARYAAAEDLIILRPWVLYNTTLVLWAYGAIMDVAEESTDQSHWTPEEYLSHMLNGLMGDGDLTQHQGAKRTTGLIAAVQTALVGCRWGLLEEAKETLSCISTQTAILSSMACFHTPGDQDEDQE